MSRTAFPIAAMAAAALWATLAPVASAAPEAKADEVITVRAGDLDLNTPTGARAMLNRVDEAATRMCWPEKLNTFAEFGTCRATVILDAVTTINKPMVSLAYAEAYPSKAKPFTVASR
jgi:UrcA family protein